MSVAGEKPSVLLSRTTVNQNVRNSLRSLVENEMLAEFWTTVTWDPNSRWNRLLPSSLQKQLARKSISEAPQDKVRSVPFREAMRLALRGTPFTNILCKGERPFSVVSMDFNFDQRVARRVRELRPNIVYAYEGAALQTFGEARKQGLQPSTSNPAATGGGRVICSRKRQSIIRSSLVSSPL